MKLWWMRPSKIPDAPGWNKVCLFGAVWNAVVNQSLFGVLFCLGLSGLIYALDKTLE